VGGSLAASPPHSRTSTRSALVPNTQGLTAALALSPQVLHKLSVFTAASETFALKNTNATIAQTLDRFIPVIAGAHQHHLSIRGYISCVIACPFEGPIAPAAVRRAADQLWNLGVDEIDLGDTIGAADPASTRALLHEFRDWPNGRNGQPGLTLHLHDTFGKAASCVRVALDSGLRSFDGSVAGLGGCPYASTPTNRAPGNISTELLVRTIHDAGLRTHVDLAALEAAATFARDIVAKSRAASQSAGATS
jgi:hydroxymethylglutaryl-CoA lyase